MLYKNPQIVYDRIIVGGGLAGLYGAYCYMKRYPKSRVLILEKEGRFGGRIHTYQDKDGLSMELGAGRFHSKHVMLLQLLRELGLVSKIHRINNIQEDKQLSTLLGKFVEDVKNQKSFTNPERSEKSEKSEKSENLLSLSMVDYVRRRRIMTAEELQYVLDHYGYSAELHQMNVYDLVPLMEEIMLHPPTFYGLKGGLSQIIDKLVAKLERSGCTMMLNRQVSWVGRTLVPCASSPSAATKPGFVLRCDDIQRRYYSTSCVLALPKEALKTLSMLRPVAPLLNNVITTPLCRIYAVYDPLPDTGRVWFAGKTKEAVNNPLRMVIPLNEETGLIMASYTDGLFAEYWQRIWQRGGSRAVGKTLNQWIEQFYGIKPGAPRKIKMVYWDSGVGNWAPGVRNSEDVAHKLVQPLGTTVPLYICGENYNRRQQWMESALESAVKTM
jgi:monoamine oxidase